MPKDSQASRLTESEELELQRGYYLRELQLTPGWQQVLLPALTAKLNQEWFDPKQFKEGDNFLQTVGNAYVVSFAERQAAGWIARFLEAAEKETLALEEKKARKVDVEPFDIGREGAA